MAVDSLPGHGFFVHEDVVFLVGVVAGFEVRFFDFGGDELVFLVKVFVECGGKEVKFMVLFFTKLNFRWNIFFEVLPQ